MNCHDAKAHSLWNRIRVQSGAWFSLCLCVLVVFSVSGAENRVLELDGNGSYVELPADLLKGVEEVTVEGWVKWDRFGGWSRFIDFGEAGHGIHICQTVDTSTLNLSCGYASGLNTGYLTVPNLLRTNQ